MTEAAGSGQLGWSNRVRSRARQQPGGGRGQGREQPWEPLVMDYYYYGVSRKWCFSAALRALVLWDGLSHAGWQGFL